MSFLAWLSSLLVKPVLSWLYDKVASLILWGLKVYRRKRSEENANEAVGEALKNAHTKEERDNAAEQVRSNF